ncbi:MAG: FkbM family methyltransferase [Lachnospiraceae bacterium]|nr:FkbM family methyltransferase [Lachnospiraceae bacterium]
MNIEMLYKIYNNLQDEESKYLYELKIQEAISGKYKNFIEGLATLNKKWNISSYDDCTEKCKEKEVIVFGAGADGKMTLHLLNQKGIKVKYFCDNNYEKWNKEYLGIPVISTQDVKIKHKDSLVILASQLYAPVFYKQLVDSYFPRENIWYPRVGVLYATNGEQYFDCPSMKREDGEVFIDCGCFDGETSKQFVQWCEGKYDRIIAFEPDKRNYEICQRECTDIRNFELYASATGACKKKMKFNMGASGGSKIDENGFEEVYIDSIDDILQGHKATFIKMDVEGAELDSLKGAEETIKKYKPKLAIAIYHKAEDIWEIPQFILSCREDYKFYIRHYTSCNFETVLYAL